MRPAITASLIQCKVQPNNDKKVMERKLDFSIYAPTHDVAPRAVSIADAIDAIS
jgi:hypothetical protein